MRELDDIDINEFVHGLIDGYAARPTGAPFDSMTLAHFAVWYHTVCGSSEEDEAETTSSRLPCFPLQNAMGTIAQRWHQACLRVPVMTPVTW